MPGRVFLEHASDKYQYKVPRRHVHGSYWCEPGDSRYLTENYPRLGGFT
jgi:hypothetical protein